LNADHHSICKFENRQDANYTSVKNILRYWASELRDSRIVTLDDRRTSDVELKDLEESLGIRDSAETDLDTLSSKILDGTCQWITTKPDFVCWLESSRSSTQKMFWLMGPAGTGKTSLARSVIEYLKLHGQECVYHFFSSSHQLKRTSAYCLRSIAFQIALINDEFRDQLSNLIEEPGVKFNSQTLSLNVIWEKIFVGILFKLNLQNPLFLVLDAFDEADSRSLVSLFMKMPSTLPIKLFLTSRPMNVPSTPAASCSLTTCLLSEEDTCEDIQAFVQNAVSNELPGDYEFQKDIVGQVVAKASGSFLWVKLALETLQNNWHTKDDIRRALNEVPQGMKPLYQQMLHTVKSQPSRFQSMAKIILTWAICSWRHLSVAELQIALQPEFDGFVRLEYTIVQICGHFIAIKNSKITLVHETARKFLLDGNDDSPPYINPRDGHEKIAMALLKYLSDDRWRIVLKDHRMPVSGNDLPLEQNRLSLVEKSHPLFGYATVYWAYHVSKSSAMSEELPLVVETFLERYALPWIEAIAVLGNLRHITKSAQYLKAYAKNRSRGSNANSKDNLLSLVAPPTDGTPKMLESWANDFIHIVGKFGRNLMQQPPSIYRLIPPFCPHHSVFGMTYQVSVKNAISVAGLPPDGWGDCLASVNVGEEEIASKVLATDAYFINLISSNGTIVIWYAETCGEARRIYHKEYVPIMALNGLGTRLVTAGMSTYRVWDISTGKELYCLTKSSESRTMTIAFGATDSELIEGLDDCSVTRYDLETSSIKSRWVATDSYQELEGCPSVMAISPNLNKVAIAWRGKPLSVWDMTRSSPPQRCKVTGSTDPLSAPELVKWQVDGNSVMILCLSNQIVQWDLFDEDQTEHRKYHDLNAREMAISADGNFLLTCDNFGTMSVWTFPRLRLIYQLVNKNEFIRDITFSPSGQRIYDTRDSMCNVWEPDALVRPDEQDLEDTSSIAESFSATEPIIINDESSESQVTAFATGPNDLYYCCGKEDGTVTIHEATGGAKVRKVYAYATTSSVMSLAWSASGKYIVSSDDSGRVVSKRLELKDGGKWAVFPGLDIRISETIRQFVFSSNEKLLLISTPSGDHVYDMKRKGLVCSQSRQKLLNSKWITDPTDPETLLEVGNETVGTYKWATLEFCDSGELPEAGLTNELAGDVRKVSLTKDKKNIVYETLPTRSSEGPQISIFATSSRSHPWKAGLSCQVKRLIGIFQNRIVFLDNDYWLCTWEIDANSSDVQRHFFLPMDWLNTSTLQMATVNEQGTLFCPKFGKVIIVRNGIRL
jgi:WD40 repeat protein